MLSKNIEDRVRMTFSFSLYATPLQVVLVIYFGRVFGELRELRLLKDGKVCHCQHWKLILVLVNFQNKLLQCKLPVYILSILLKIHTI